MQTKSGNRSAKPQGARRNPAKGRKSKRSISERRISGRGRGGTTNTSPGPTPQPNFLNPGIGELDPFNINAPQAFQGDYYDDDSLGPMKEWVVALYKCLKHHKGFKDNHEWEGFPSMTELARYLIEQVKALNTENYNWSFAKNRNEKEYQLLFYHTISKYEDSYQLPLEWLPNLEEENEELYLLVMTILSRIAKCCNLDVIHNEYNDFITSDPEANMNGDEPDDLIFQVHIAQYNKGGAAMKFKETLKRHFYQFSLENLKRKIKSFKPHGEKEWKIIVWLELGLQVIKNPAPINEYYFPDDRVYNDGNPINANDCFNYLWSFRDMVQVHAESVMDDCAGNSGIVGPTVSSKYTEECFVESKSSEKAIEALADFMEAGRSIYMEYYDRIFIDYYKLENQERLIIGTDDQE